MRGIGGAWAAIALSWCVLACQGGKDVSPASCSDDADCGAAQRCERKRAPGPTPQLVGPCTQTPCTSDANCTTDMVCGPPPSQLPGSFCAGTVCIPRCTDSSCPSGQLCRATGLCELITCDDPGGVTCPEHWYCEPDSPRGNLQSAHALASVLEDPLAYMDLALQGCVRRSCAEDDGYACKEFYECAPDEATDPSGCLPVPCGTSDHCVSDRYTCTPTSTAPRSAGADEFGCVLKNCEEGFDCEGLTSREGVEYCDPTAPNATSDGCAIRTCVEGNPCVETFTCDPTSPLANSLGCVPPEGSSPSGGTGAGGVGGGSGGVAGASAAGGGSGESSGAAGNGTGGIGVGGAGGNGTSGAGGGGATSGGPSAATGGSDGSETELGPGRCVTR